MRGLLARLLRLVGGWLDDFSGLGGLLEGIWEVAGILLDSVWGPIGLVLVATGLLASTPRLRRWLRRKLADESQGAPLSLVPQAPLPDPISPVYSRIVRSWLAVSAIVAIGTFLLILSFNRRDSLAALAVFSLVLAGITFLGFWVNFALFGGAWHLTFDEEGVHAVSGWNRRSFGWEGVKTVSVRGRRLYISTQGHGSDLSCSGLSEEAAQRVANQLQECLDTLQLPGGDVPKDT